MENTENNILLVEYQVCMNDISQLDNDIWHTTNMFLGVSIVGFLLLIQSQCKSFADFLIYVIFACFGFSLVYLWRKFVYSWLKIIHINFYRMREIEYVLGMKRERYIQFIEEGQVTIDEKYILNDNEKDNLIIAVSVFLKKSKLGGPSGVNKYLRKLMFFVIIGWITLISKQLIFLFL